MPTFLPPVVGSQAPTLTDPRLIPGTAYFGAGSAAAVASYIAGQCTWFVAKTLDWVPPHWGDAKTWPANARAEGFIVTDKPQVGAVAAWPGLSDNGHVAVVKSVNADGSFTVSEMNYQGPYVTDSRTVPNAQGAQFILPPGSNNSATVGDLASAVTTGLNPATWMQDLASSYGRPVNDFVVDVAIVFVGLGLVLVGALVLFQVGPGDVAKAGVETAAVVVPK